MNASLLEFVGFRELALKQREFHKLKVVVLREMAVSSAEPDIGQLLKSCVSLDVSDDLFRDWRQLVEIAASLERLRMLELSGNLLPSATLAGVAAPAFACLRHLVVGRMRYGWDDVVALAVHVPALSHLQAFSNEIAEIPPLPEDAFASLEILDLNDNPVSDWRQVMAFSRLPKLNHLSLSHCKLREIEFPPGEGAEGFRALRILQLSGNAIDDFRSVANLHRLRLEDFRMRSNPVLVTENGATCRQIMIASMKTMKICNGTHIERSERIGAELDYLKKYGRAFLDVEKLPEGSEERIAAAAAFAQRHPRYPDFVRQFGPPEEDELYRKEDTTIKGNLLTLRIECPDVPDFPPVTRKLPPSMTVHKLRTLLQRVVKMKSHALVLNYKGMAFPDQVFPLDDDLKELTYYSLKDDDVIFVTW